jgi:hypothetical protein
VCGKGRAVCRVGLPHALRCAAPLPPATMLPRPSRLNGPAMEPAVRHNTTAGQCSGLDLEQPVHGRRPGARAVASSGRTSSSSWATRPRRPRKPGAAV